MTLQYCWIIIDFWEDIKFSKAFHTINYEINLIKRNKFRVLLEGDIHGYRSYSVVIGGLSLKFKKSVRIIKCSNFHGHRNLYSR